MTDPQIPPDDHDTIPPEFDPESGGGVMEPPTTFGGKIRQIGPGLIIAASIVGSGELIATTKTGAQAGMSLLWLIIIGCVIKVFAQIELGRYTISNGETTLAAIDQVPAPRLKVNLIIWLWVFMTLAGIAQLGGIVGGVGQSLALTIPFSGDYDKAIQVPSEGEIKRFLAWKNDLDGTREHFNEIPESDQKRVLRGQEVLQQKLDSLGEQGTQLITTVQAGKKIQEPYTRDDKYWAAIVAVITSALLYYGRYNLLQQASLVLVAMFTIVTVGNVISLQMSEEFSIPLSVYLDGLKFRLPTSHLNLDSDVTPIATALMTFGIIGVGASELVSYPYWCIEKGYAKFTGPRSDDDNWRRRAKGWIGIMYYDAFSSMALYTVVTLLFFVMGVAVLYNEGRDPDGMRMVATLCEAYVPVFGEYARWLFLLGAFAVLYSTFLAANAANARMYTDALKLFDVIDRHKQSTHDRVLNFFSLVLPVLCLAIFLTGANPVTLVLISGFMQAITLPLLGLSAVYFRYARTPKELQPTPLWDICLVLSCIGLLITGGWALWEVIQKVIKELS